MREYIIDPGSAFLNSTTHEIHVTTDESPEGEPGLLEMAPTDPQLPPIQIITSPDVLTKRKPEGYSPTPDDLELITKLLGEAGNRTHKSASAPAILNNILKDIS
jgi:hypothetical protein